MEKTTVREIKFRVWDQYREAMIYDAVDHYASFLENGKVITVGVMGVNPIMQYTGLKDKNGKEIYEGDIIALGETDYEYEVRFSDAKFVAYHSAPKYQTIGRWGDLCRFYELHFDIEVIRNIYEGSHLIKI